MKKTVLATLIALPLLSGCLATGGVVGGVTKGVSAVTDAVSGGLGGGLTRGVATRIANAVTGAHGSDAGNYDAFFSAAYEQAMADGVLSAQERTDLWAVAQQSKPTGAPFDANILSNPDAQALMEELAGSDSPRVAD